MTIDTHAHLNFSAYRDDAEEVIKRSLERNVWMINVGSQYTTSKRAVGLAEKYGEGVYAAVGLHPIHLETGLVRIKDDPEEVQFKTREESFRHDKYKELAENKKVVAIGEIGFDYYWKPKTKARVEQFKEKQKEVFLEQLDLAQELGLPVIIHCRMAHEELISVLKERNQTELKGVIHCFTGNWQQAQEYISMGLSLGFNGIIFKLDMNETLEKIPLDKILIETDCPYLTPSPMTGRNEPIYVKYVAEEIAKIKSLKLEEITNVTSENAKKLFRI